MTRFEPSGDRFQAVEFYRGTRIFDPQFIKKCTIQEKHNRIGKLKHYHILNTPKMIEGLKASFKHIKELASKVTSSNVDVPQCHFPLMEKLEKELKEYAVLFRCANCKCNHLHYPCGNQSVLRWWEVYALVVLVQPSLMAAKRVF
jgi:hypothetical protein